MTAPTKLLPAHIRQDLTATLARLRQAKLLHPRHEQPPGNTWHIGGCEICRTQRRIDWLLDQLLK